MERQAIFTAIEKERAFQDKTYPDRAQYVSLNPHMTILECLIDNLKKKWYYSHSENNYTADCKRHLVAIAAVAVRALEETKNFH